MKAYSLLSWNIEHLGKNKGGSFINRLNRITEEIKTVDPDVFAIYEVEGSDVFTKFVESFPGYSFHITEGPQSQEILLGVRGGMTSFFTQKVQFKSGVHLLRPGALLTLKIDEKVYPILFLHLKSLQDPRGFGLRDDQIRKAKQFAKVLGTDEIPANYLFIGDLNTMGLDYYFKKDISAEYELKRSDYYAKRYYKLKRLGKTYSNTWNNGSGSSYEPSNLDHCYSAEHMTFKSFQNKDKEGASPVDVRGWVDINNTAERDQWIKDYSDHAYLYLEVQNVED